ncbi:MAG: phosphoenolpyruvate--protein phosphotransferase [Chitinispirillaceae bacterium]|nr:phosphoenolpyruvate--protein phosphotransferase [Chitinispirillaceae bacterium]
MAHIELLFDISELQWVVRDNANIEEFLTKAVEMTARHMQTDVCSIYLYDDSSSTLSLKATRGLNPDLVGKVTLNLGEGITGLALKELRPICDNHGSRHPNYKFFSGLQEEIFDAFLAVPIIHGIRKIGVLVVQRKKGHDFTSDDTTALRAVSNQLASIIENARELIAMRELRNKTVQQPAAPQVVLKLIRGKAAASGFTLGPAKIEIKSRSLDRLEERSIIAHHGLDDFKAAVAATRQQVTERQQAVEERLSDVASLIFTAHLMLLQDELFYGHIVGNINAGLSAEKAILSTARHYISLFSAQDNPYMREKADDIRDLSIRIFENLQGTEQAATSYRDHIIVARELLPSDILVLSSEGIAGVVLIAGGVTSHLSVLARSLGIPLIIADEPRLLDIPDATPLLLDGETGNVYVNPNATVRENFAQREQARRELLTHRDAIADITRTADGTVISLLANINLLSDVKNARDLKCEGVGLYRTEFPFIVRSTFPTEEEQVVVYRKLVEGMEGRPVTFRTLDIGGDKILPYYDHFAEQNPFLGMRSIRFALRNMEIFRQQVRAILRAGHGASLGIMFPMISMEEEFAAACGVVDSCIAELRSENLPYNDAPRIGIMIEIPAMVEIIDTLAERVDFFSIGTNDFVQYMLAVDRTNEKVASLYLPHHPAVLRALDRIVQVAGAHGKPVSVCGDMAHQTEYLPFLIGIGISALSVDAVYIPQLQKAIAAISLSEARATASEVLRETAVGKIGTLLGIPG